MSNEDTKIGSESDENRTICAIEHDVDFNLYQASGTQIFNGAHAMALLLKVLTHARQQGLEKPLSFRVRIETFHPKKTPL